MNLAELKTIVTGETLCKQGQLFIAKWISEGTVCLVDYATETNKFYLRFENPDTPGWIKELYRSDKNGTPRTPMQPRAWDTKQETHMKVTYQELAKEFFNFWAQVAQEGKISGDLTGAETETIKTFAKWLDTKVEDRILSEPYTLPEPDYAPDWALGQE